MNKPKPKVSIVIPTFNCERTIERCLRSVGEQSFRDYEVVIQDGGSSDGTLEKIAEFKKTSADVDVQASSEKDRGPYDAMNKGIKRASGEWLYFLGGDDELHDCNVLQKAMQHAQASGADVLYGNVRVVGDAGWASEGAIYDGVFDLAKFLTKNICHQAMFYRADFHRKVGEYNLRYCVCADWDFNMRCWSRGRFEYFDLIVANFHAGGISGRGDERFGSELASIVLRNFDLSVYDPLVNRPAFPAFADIRRMQQAGGLVRRTIGRIRAAVGGGVREGSRA
jgi:glycosyltransferase involved in cell wall biosynthesis